MVPPETHTQPRQIRIRDELWDRFAVATEHAGTDRSTMIREFVEWYVHEPNSRRMTRPDRPTDAELAAWREANPPRSKRAHDPAPD
jgi:hypothetical protein